ncbi:MAG: DUF1707 SHOCT-like domain-containing protein [Nocardioides sp.]
MATGDLWREFEHDPRSPTYAAMRASDRDRDLVHGVLGEAFAQGRIDSDELHERTDVVNRAKTLGELPPVVVDLVPPSGAPSALVSAAGPSDDVRSQAVARWERSRREALMAFLTPTLICWAVWAATMLGGFPWPVFVMIGTGMGLVSTLVRKQDMIESNERRILKKQQKGLEARDSPPELEA